MNHNSNEVNSYLRELLKNYPQAKRISQTVEQPIAKYQQQICNGRYHIQYQTETNPEKAPSPEKVTAEEHQRFMNKIKEEKEKLLEKRKQRVSLEKEKQKQTKEELLKKEEEEKKEKELQRKKEIQERMNEMNTLKQKRIMLTEERNKEFQAVKNSQTLHQKLLANFQRLQFSSLEVKKKKLAEIRAFHKPISRSEFEEHNQKVQKFRLKAAQERAKSNLIENRSSSASDIYKSIWYQKIKDQNPARQFTEKQMQQALKIKEKKQRLKKYAEYIQENFKPEIDEKKTQQIKEVTSNKSQRETEFKENKSKMVGNDYLRYSISQTNPVRSVSQMKTNTNITESSHQPSKPIDYLEEIRKNRKPNEQKVTVIQNILKQPMDDIHKVAVAKGHIEVIQEKAKRRERLSKINQNVVDQELDALYVNTIKAKLALLK